MLYLSAADVAAAGLSPDAVRQAVEAAYRASANGAVRAPPKLALDLGDRTVQAMAAALMGERRAAVKWVSVVPADAAKGATVRAWILLTDMATGEGLALMEGAWITAVRTAAMSAIAAQRLAPTDASSIAFIGCGVQARSHLEALARVRPDLKSITACSRTRESAEAFVGEAEALGFSASVETDPRRAVAERDIVVTSVPAGPGVTLLDPAWFAPDSFVAAVDLGRSIRREGFGRFAVIATDDRTQSEVLAKAGKLNSPGPFAFDLADLVRADAGDVRRDRAGPVLFVFAGHSLADLAVAQAVYAAACARGLGLQLPQ